MILAFDTESSGATNGTTGDPFCPDNTLTCISYSILDGESDVLPIEYGKEPYGPNLRRFEAMLRDSRLVVGFAIKRDLHWLRRYGVCVRNLEIWDVQSAHFILSHQTEPDPSLDIVSRSNLEGRGKIETVKNDYWDKGIDNPDVPWDILYEYSLDDADLTLKNYIVQQRQLQGNSKLGNLIKIHNHDISVTQEMEYNGLKFNLEKSNLKATKTHEEIKEVERQLSGLVAGDVPVDWDSKDNLSALLYGGIVKRKERVAHPFTYKDGTTTTKERWETKEYTFPRLVTPLPNTEYKKGGYYQTNEKVLLTLSADRKVREIIRLMLERTKLCKLVGTYYEGIPKLYREMGWENHIIHGSLVHCRAATGRLASRKPNQQNMDERVLECIESRF